MTAATWCAAKKLTKITSFLCICLQSVASMFSFCWLSLIISRKAHLFPLIMLIVTQSRLVPPLHNLQLMASTKLTQVLFSELPLNRLVCKKRFCIKCNFYEHPCTLFLSLRPSSWFTRSICLSACDFQLQKKHVYATDHLCGCELQQQPENKNTS